MNRLGELLGSATRGNIVEALALSNRPLTGYRISKLYNMNTAKVYIAMKALARLGLVRSCKGRAGIEYQLSDEDLRRLALRLSSRVVTYESWKSLDAKATRFRSGFAKPPPASVGRPAKLLEKKSARLLGELENLALLSRRKFDAKYRVKSVGVYSRI
jgi:hypothetical protein